MIDLDFSKIRIHDGSQNNGFEELVCQLAHLSIPNGADFFVRKDGAGGDAGVECYWKLLDGSEQAWQAKYFINPLDSSQWTQICDSVEAALKKHPKLTKYYICLPRDWNDSRKKGTSGKTVTSAWDQWQKHVGIWQKIATSRGMSVEFTYWCKHEISSLLQQDKAEFSGRAKYWFGTPILTSKHFSRLVQISRLALGDRYTPEYHLDLPIAEIIESLGKTNYWWDLLAKQLESWKESASKAEGAIVKVRETLKISESISLEQDIDGLASLFIHRLKNRTFLETLEDSKSRLDVLKNKLSAISNKLLSTSSTEEDRSVRSDIYGFERAVDSFGHFITRNVTKVALKRAVLLAGEAGMGKSHLLCDIALSRIDEELPTVFILGQHYLGGNPLTTLKDQLDLSDVSHEVLLGALDAAGEANHTKTLVIIDAINEGR